MQKKVLDKRRKQMKKKNHNIPLGDQNNWTLRNIHEHGQAYRDNWHRNQRKQNKKLAMELLNNFHSTDLNTNAEYKSHKIIQNKLIQLKTMICKKKIYSMSKMVETKLILKKKKRNNDVFGKKI